MDSLPSRGAELYGTIYFAAILSVALLESVVPARESGPSIGRRWVRNFTLSVFSTALIRMSFPLAGVAWAVFCEQRGWGLLAVWETPFWLGIALTIVAIDFTYYAHHYLSHTVGLLWRLHRTHHSDLEYDFSTGARFHPLEVVGTTLFVMATIAAIGALPAGVMLSQMLLAVVAFSDHANVVIPERVDKAIRLVFVTPNMHRVHHSVEHVEGNSNFSNTFSFWDRLFGTYRDQPAAGHARMEFGLREVRDGAQLTLPRLLTQPFVDLTASPTADVRPVEQPAVERT